MPKFIKLTSEAQIIVEYWRAIEAGKNPEEAYKKAKEAMDKLRMQKK